MTGAEILDRLEADGILRVLRCEHVMETWGPHAGCREFMTEPDVWTCGESATHVALFDDVDGGGGTYPERMHLCATHGMEMVLDDIEHGPFSPVAGRMLVVML